MHAVVSETSRKPLQKASESYYAAKETSSRKCTIPDTSLDIEMNERGAPGDQRDLNRRGTRAAKCCGQMHARCISMS